MKTKVANWATHGMDKKKHKKEFTKIDKFGRPMMGERWGKLPEREFRPLVMPRWQEAVDRAMAQSWRTVPSLYP